MKHIHILTIAILFFLIPKKAIAQTFQRTYGSSFDDTGAHLLATNDNNFAVLGIYGESGGIYLIKADSMGNTLWQKILKSPNGTVYKKDINFRQTLDSGFIIVAGIYHSNGANICLVKTNSFGDTLWTKSYSGPNPGNNIAIAKEIIITNDNGYAIVGTEMGPIDKNVFLIKTDSLGNLQYAKYYGGSNDDEGYSIKQTSDGGFIMAGYTYSFGQGFWDVYLVKVNIAGTLLWTKTYGGNRADCAHHIEITNDGGFIMTGITSGFGTGPIYTDDLFLMKTDSNGNSIWAYTYGGNSDESGNSVKQNADGDFIATGYTSSAGAGQEDVYFLKTDSVGNILWSKTYGGSSTEQGNDIIQNGVNYLIVGETRNFSKGYEDVYLIKTDSLGNDTCKQNNAITFKTVLPWLQSNGGVEYIGHTIKNELLNFGNPDTASYQPCICVPPVANFYVSMTDGYGSFYNNSTWATTWYWDFGDGDTSTIENPGHQWQNGVYQVCLIVTNECGSDTLCDTIAAYGAFNEIGNHRKQLFVAPNPFDNFTIIKFENTKNEKYEMQIVNPLGQSLFKINNITVDKVRLEKNNLQNGLYFVKLIKGNEIVGAAKILVK